MSLWTAVFPFDVVKSRMQIQKLEMSPLSLMVKIGRNEGKTDMLLTGVMLEF